MLTLPLLVIAGQLADGLAYQLAHGNGAELNPAMGLLIPVFGPFAILGVKVVGLSSSDTVRWHSTVIDTSSPGWPSLGSSVRARNCWRSSDPQAGHPGIRS
jgi:hypothetical protein